MNDAIPKRRWGRAVRKAAANWVGYCLMEGFSRLFRLLPFEAASALGDLGGLLAFVLAPRERRRARRNLEIAFGDSMTAAGRTRCIRSMFRHFGRDMGEAFAATGLSTRELEARVDNARELADHLRSVLAEGKGLIAMTGHLGNWELLGTLGARTVPLSVVANRFHFEPYNRVVDRFRTEGGMKTIYLSRSPRDIVRALRANEAVGLLPDQDIRKIPGVFVPFFGRPAWTPIGPVLVARLSGAPMIPYFLVRRGRRYHAEIGDRIPLVFTGDRQVDLQTNTRRWSEAYEGFIRRYPDQWGWNHLRWNTRPSAVRPAFRSGAVRGGAGPGEPPAGAIDPAGRGAVPGGGAALGAGGISEGETPRGRPGGGESLGGSIRTS